MTTQMMTDEAAAGSRSPAASSSSAAKIATLRHRSDFLHAARARKMAKPAFILQIRNRHDDDPTMRVGFTCSKKVGNAVSRNRAKRRLREIARLTLPVHGREGHDYVLIGRAGVTASYPFDRMLADLRGALA
jgi:ribonuclease P protein component